MAKWIPEWDREKLVDEHGEILATVHKSLCSTDYRYGGREFINAKSAKAAAERDTGVSTTHALGGGGRGSEA